MLRYVGQCAAGNLFHFLEYEQTETKEFANIHGPSIVRLRELLLGLTRTQPKLRFLPTQLQEVIELFDKDVPTAIENKSNLPRKPMAKLKAGVLVRVLADWRSLLRADTKVKIVTAAMNPLEGEQLRHLVAEGRQITDGQLEPESQEPVSKKKKQMRRTCDETAKQHQHCYQQAGRRTKSSLRGR